MHLLSPTPWIVLLTALALAAPAGPRAAATIDTPATLPAIQLRTPPSTDLAAYRYPTAIPFPPDAPYTPAMARLGRTLFFDARLSRSGTVSCGSCHNPAFSWTTGTGQGFYADGVPWPRRVGTVANLAWRDDFMADGRFTDLSDQVFEAMENPSTMGLPRALLATILDQVPAYQTLLAAAAPGQPITPDLVARAIATFERSVVYPPSTFDRFVAGETTALSESGKRGFALFTGRAGCSACHAGWNFTDDGFHDIGLPGPDLGRGAFMPHVVKLQHAFRTPGLRDIARRGPYMHDGSIPTLAAVIDHYDGGGIDRPSRSELVHPIGLSATEKSDLLAFLQSLTAIDEATDTRPEKP